MTWDKARAATFERLCSLMCSIDEITDAMEQTRDELDAECLAAYGKGLDESMKSFAAKGLRNLRAAQMKSALDGNTTMQIWLGKQYLGQKDAPEQEQPKPTQAREVPLNVILNRHAERRAPAKAARRA